MEVQTPRVNDGRRYQEGRRHHFTSQILPPYLGRPPKVVEELPIIYLRDWPPAISRLR